MIFIITEDQTAGFIFWKRIFEQYKVPHCVYPSYGSANIARFLNRDTEGCVGSLLDSLESFVEASKSVTAADAIFIAVDRFKSDYLDCIFDALSHYECRKYITTYWSWECAILSFSRFKQWVCPNLDNKVYLSALDRFLWYLNNTNFETQAICTTQSGEAVLPFMAIEERLVKEGSRVRVEKVFVLEECDPTMQEYYNYRLSAQGKKFSTQEQVVKDLLEVLTLQTGFEVKGKRFGDCWHKDCCWAITDGGHELNALKKCKQLALIEGRDGLTNLPDSCWTGKQKLSILLSESLFDHCVEDPEGSVHSLNDVIDSAQSYETSLEAEEDLTTLFV